MISLDDYASLLMANGKHLGEVRKTQSDQIMNATFTGDISYRKVYILTPDDGWQFVDAKFSRHVASSIAKDQVDSYLQFRPKVHFPVGCYVFIPDDTSYEMNIDLEDPLHGDVSNLWLIVNRNDSKQFVRYLVLKCNWNYRWVYGLNGEKQVFNCWGVARNANSYTSCDAICITRLAAVGNAAVYSFVYAGTALEP